jgi:hypothetical protein
MCVVQRTLAALDTLGARVDVFLHVFSDQRAEFGSLIASVASDPRSCFAEEKRRRVRSGDASEAEAGAGSNFSSGTVRIVAHSSAFVRVPADRHFLTWLTRPLMREQALAREYDVFLYCEDDVLLRRAGLRLWCRHSAAALRAGHWFSFVRFEASSPDCSSDFWEAPNEFARIGGTLFRIARASSYYNALWLVTGDQMRAYAAHPIFVDKFLRFARQPAAALREMDAAASAAAATTPQPRNASTSGGVSSGIRDDAQQPVDPRVAPSSRLRVREEAAFFFAPPVLAVGGRLSGAFLLRNDTACVDDGLLVEHLGAGYEFNCARKPSLRRRWMCVSDRSPRDVVRGMRDGERRIVDEP